MSDYKLFQLNKKKVISASSSLLPPQSVVIVYDHQKRQKIEQIRKEKKIPFKIKINQNILKTINIVLCFFNHKGV